MGGRVIPDSPRRTGLFLRRAARWRLPSSQFAMFIAVVLRVPFALRTFENVRGTAITEGADECGWFQLAAAPLARRNFWHFHAASTAEAKFRSRRF